MWCDSGGTENPRTTHGRTMENPFGDHSSMGFFLMKQLVVNSKKIGGSAAGQTKRIEKDRSSLVSF